MAAQGSEYRMKRAKELVHFVKRAHVRGWKVDRDVERAVIEIYNLLIEAELTEDEG